MSWRCPAQTTRLRWDGTSQYTSPCGRSTGLLCTRWTLNLSRQSRHHSTRRMLPQTEATKPSRRPRPSQPPITLPRGLMVLSSKQRARAHKASMLRPLRYRLSVQSSLRHIQTKRIPQKRPLRTVPKVVSQKRMLLHWKQQAPRNQSSQHPGLHLLDPVPSKNQNPRQRSTRLLSHD